MPKSALPQTLGIREIASCHLYLRDLDRTCEHFVQNLDFCELARTNFEATRTLGVRSSLVSAGNARFLVSEPTARFGECFRWLEEHPEGAGCIEFDVVDLDLAYTLLRQRNVEFVTAAERSLSSRKDAFEIETPFGKPSDALTIGRIHGTEVAFDFRLPGIGHQAAQHRWDVLLCFSSIDS